MLTIALRKEYPVLFSDAGQAWKTKLTLYAEMHAGWLTGITKR
jgi:hypothetical protein